MSTVRSLLRITQGGVTRVVRITQVAGHGALHPSTSTYPASNLYPGGTS